MSGGPRGREDIFRVFPFPCLVLAGPGTATGAREMGWSGAPEGWALTGGPGGGAQLTVGEGLAPGGAFPTTGSVGDWYYCQAAFSLFPARQIPRYSPVAKLSPRISWSPGPSVVGGCRPVLPPPETAVMEASGEAPAGSSGLWGGRRASVPSRTAGKGGGHSKRYRDGGWPVANNLG